MTGRPDSWADDHGTPLCRYHRGVIQRMAAWSHVDADVTRQATNDLARQCCVWRPKEEA